MKVKEIEGKLKKNLTKMNLPGGGIWVRSTALLDMARHAEVALNTYLLKDVAREVSKHVYYYNIRYRDNIFIIDYK